MRAVWGRGTGARCGGGTWVDMFWDGTSCAVDVEVLEGAPEDVEAFLNLVFLAPSMCCAMDRVVLESAPGDVETFLNLVFLAPSI